MKIDVLIKDAGTEMLRALVAKIFDDGCEGMGTVALAGTLMFSRISSVADPWSCVST